MTDAEIARLIIDRDAWKARAEAAEANGTRYRAALMTIIELSWTDGAPMIEEAKRALKG